MGFVLEGCGIAYQMQNGQMAVGEDLQTALVYVQMFYRIMVGVNACLCIYLGGGWAYEVNYNNMAGSRHRESHTGCTCERHIGNIGGREYLYLYSVWWNA